MKKVRLGVLAVWNAVKDRGSDQVNLGTDESVTIRHKQDFKSKSHHTSALWCTNNSRDPKKARSQQVIHLNLILLQ